MGQKLRKVERSNRVGSTVNDGSFVRDCDDGGADSDTAKPGVEWSGLVVAVVLCAFIGLAIVRHFM